MADFKLVGDPDLVILSSLGQMTQGIGFPLRTVDTAGAPVQVGDPVGIDQTSFLAAADYTTQTPLGLGVVNELQISFGAAQAPYLDALGTFTEQVDTARTFTVFLNGQRLINNAGQARMWIYAKLNDVATGTAQAVLIDNQNSYWAFNFTIDDLLSAGDTLKFFVFRDSSFNDDGSLVSVSSGELGVPDSPSAFMQVSSLVIL
jgi:hypothetical protein